MHAMPIERKKILVHQNRLYINQQAPVNPKARNSASFGPSSAAALLPRLVPQLTGDSGLIRRFSVIGWGSGSTSAVPPVVDNNESLGEFNSNTSSKDTLQAQMSNSLDDIQPLQPQSTGSLWSSWWASAGGDKVEKNTDKESVKSAQWYIDGLRLGKAPDMKLVKHLITLRVHLSTAKVAFIQDFVSTEKGLTALGTLLSSLVGRGGKKRALGETETIVLLEVLKCLRVLLNTAVCQFDSFIVSEIYSILYIARLQRSAGISNSGHAYIVYAPCVVAKDPCSGI